MSQQKPILYFTPYAWSKLIHLRDLGGTEVSGMGVTHPENPLLVCDMMMVKQECTSVYTEFDDEAVSNFFEDMVDMKYHPSQFGRVWIHTHPGNSPNPSGTDETTFREVFGRCDHAIMFIIARGGEVYARMNVKKPVPLTLELDVKIAYFAEFPASNHEAWKKEYESCVTEKKYVAQHAHNGKQYDWSRNGNYGNGYGHWGGWDESVDQHNSRQEQQQEHKQLTIINPELQKQAELQAYRNMSVADMADEYCSAYYSNDVEVLNMLEQVLKEKGPTYHDQVMDFITTKYGGLDEEQQLFVGG